MVRYCYLKLSRGMRSDGRCESQSNAPWAYVPRGTDEVWHGSGALECGRARYCFFLLLSCYGRSLRRPRSTGCTSASLQVIGVHEPHYDRKRNCGLFADFYGACDGSRRSRTFAARFDRHHPKQSPDFAHDSDVGPGPSVHRRWRLWSHYTTLSSQRWHARPGIVSTAGRGCREYTHHEFHDCRRCGSASCSASRSSGASDGRLGSAVQMV